MATKFHKVFVYGTLKRGEPNHQWFSKDEAGKYKFLFEAETTEKYPLIIGSNYNIPFLLYSPGKGNNVRGEIYEVDDKVMANLDILEDHPNFYVREDKQFKPLSSSGDSTVTAWVYFIKNFKSHLLNSTMYKSYSNNSPEHNLKYVERYLRDPNYKASLDILGN